MKSLHNASECEYTSKIQIYTDTLLSQQVDNSFCQYICRNRGIEEEGMKK